MPVKIPKSTLRNLLFAVIFLTGVCLTSEPIRSNAGISEDLIWDGTLRRVRVPVLMYHYISVPPHTADAIRLDLSVTPENFHQQMQWLKDKGYHTITPDQLAAAMLRGAKLPPKPILLTFDDGYEDAFSNAFPILKEFGFTGTFFVVSDFVEKEGYLTWAQAGQMAEAGMYIQDHSRSHKDLRNRDHDWLVSQIVMARDRIEAKTGIRPRFFCYPSGEYDDNVIHEVQAAGFIGAFTTNDGTFVYTDNMMQIPRVRIRGSASIDRFAYLMAWVR